jgi:hypothetical protein
VVITGAAMARYGRDAAYPAGWEPSASDFLSPALVEAELDRKVPVAGSARECCRTPD